MCCGSVARQAVDAAFARSRDAPLLDDYVKGAERLDMRVADGYPHATVHDVRRTAATHMSKHGLGKAVRSRILNHKGLSVDAIYDRYAYFDEKAEALSE